MAAPVARASAKMRYTDATPIPRSPAIASRVLPASASRSTSLALARAVGARPLYLPSAAALAIPSRCRSSIRSRSKAAMAPTGRVMGIEPFATHAQDDKADAALRQIGLDGQQFGGAARQTVLQTVSTSSR